MCNTHETSFLTQ